MAEFKHTDHLAFRWNVFSEYNAPLDVDRIVFSLSPVISSSEVTESRVFSFGLLKCSYKIFVSFYLQHWDCIMVVVV